MRQEINLQPNGWPGGSPTAPLVVAGDPGWSNYRVSTDALLEQAGYVDLIGRLGAQSESSPGASQGYHLRITNVGNWSLFKEDINGNDTQLGSGTKSFGLNVWHNLALWFRFDTVKAFIDSALITTINDGTYYSGQAGFLVSKWQSAEFDNIEVDSTGEGGLMTIDDAVEGDGIDSFNYVGSGWQHCAACGSDLYDGTNSWDNTTNDYVTVEFQGTGIDFYGVKDPKHGIGAISVDGGSETYVDFYSATRAGNQLMWASPVLANGNHVFKIRVTGTKNASSSDYFVVPDRVDILGGGVTAVQQLPPVPTGYMLFQNHPNPFNPTTMISYQLPTGSQVKLEVYDVLGREVETLVNEREGPGIHSVSFDANKLTSGVYFYRLNAFGSDGRSFSSVKKMIVLK